MSLSLSSSASSSAAAASALEAEASRMAGLYYSDWCTGKSQYSRHDLEAQISQALADDCYVIVPWGDMISKQDLMGVLKFAYGRSKKGMKVTVDEFQILSQFESSKDDTTLTLVTFQETQTEPKKSDVIRRTTALMETLRDGSIRWRHIHATWMVPPEEESAFVRRREDSVTATC
ncbi:expressed unknown protein [Seminavis robusta]|uniref:Uncharacterized protein n=1 Tax=Seminavis robusta TaxID=568900 RepID=A0A9N8EU51_9STRA|nr:expressed unknown protein [Seminavis robusta]|eukprot:Sro1633_g287340.1 n/a (175) ;mRNA; f:6434-6958